jgi:thioesterase domain-containing protein
MTEPGPRSTTATGGRPLSAARLALLRELRKGVDPVRSAPAPTMVAIRARGRLAPVHCPPPVSGSSFVYRSLAGALDPERPVHGFESPGLDGMRPPLTSIAAMAEEYLTALLAHRPDGPYLLVGYSMGGTIAFEMARRLLADGREVAVVALIDGPPPRPEPPATEEEAVRQFLADVAGAMGRDLGDIALDPAIGELPTDSRMACIHAALRAQGLVPDGVGVEFVSGRYPVFRANMQAKRAYDPPVCAVDIVAIRASRSEGTGADAWRPWTTGAVNEVVVPGDHYSIWREPGLPLLAEAIDEILRAAGPARASR